MTRTISVAKIKWLACIYIYTRLQVIYIIYGYGYIYVEVNLFKIHVQAWTAKLSWNKVKNEAISALDRIVTEAYPILGDSLSLSAMSSFAQLQKSRRN